MRKRLDATTRRYVWDRANALARRGLSVHEVRAALTRAYPTYGDSLTRLLDEWERSDLAAHNSTRSAGR
jgi:hypothetical protein